ncbi:HEPN domain protein [Acididesulfobacillus acetoxydans]|uniref:HEPN domain n=1 Tax=Acididesulfobacillus acetoxydans TaxID=1561005 RepID=A0A8S0WMC2_9FIRM|nr:HEPN domain-containing protein [Acididesulfobacillus acetoxydans]CAA7600524.1 HEPN domain protein [Acididesulfobacillus acetoxydans]CEJ06658.1 HEPN domain [Acididesulfobacillus acetoxydans]
MKENPKDILIQYRLDLSREVLADARKLFNVQGSPRSIVNRSYYAMFYAVLAALAAANLGSAKHSGVIGLFDRHSVKTGLFSKELSKTLHRAFDLRQQGDYGEATVAVDTEDATELLESAEIFLAAIQTYLKQSG